jgi:hypothetical protein
MTLEEIRLIAQSHGINADRMEMLELVRAIQCAEGYEQCFGTDKASVCGQSSCCWHEPCSLAAEPPSGKLSDEAVNVSLLPSNCSLQEAVVLAFQYYSSNDLSGARSICDHLLADKVDNFYVYYLSGIIAYQTNDRALAQKHFHSALGLSAGGTAERISDIRSRLQALS